MKTHQRILPAIVLLAACSAGLSYAEDNNVPHPASQKPDNAQTYEIKQFFIEYQPYQVGDVLPTHFLEKQYQITDWQKRHLPAPQSGAHWAYLNGNYIQLTESEGKVVQAISGDIYFR
ncbi:RcnB family protein [Pantoea sp. 1.19]|uniref:RcnB family protein n=1 Tax=Pantoea sp. 1.19 TaxID=1925589 RepID=UPI000949140E|nr:RcnB family protein [Pantoea sp. 1.19]